ncbi:MAG: 4a-hydroxytetrahydrobiopterin dehydratase [Candidatus Nitrosocosmicus sp.]|nr:4a-hydroxytetrahydrobiopterin dehydratase [Candidatus Nitrosocosmicus sp.]MDN5867470.1 4a-hydroxytetrahydrobiopterin dehydratase [Candidatus Nitrosocosmicus sp.]
MLGDTSEETQSLSKVFSFDRFPKSVKFAYLVSELAQMLNHHPVIQIDWDKVTIELHLYALGDSIYDFDLRSSILINQLYELVVEDDL